MRLSCCCVAAVGVFLTMTPTAHATVGCSVISSVPGTPSANLYSGPDEASAVIREIPLGDIVLYPEEDLAPAQAEGWVWVRYDITQEAIWQSGDFGWMKAENITDCG